MLSFLIRRLKGKVVLTRVGEKLRAHLDQYSSNLYSLMVRNPDFEVTTL